MLKSAFRFVVVSPADVAVLLHCKALAFHLHFLSSYLVPSFVYGLRLLLFFAPCKAFSPGDHIEVCLTSPSLFRELTRRCFPAAPPNAIRCYELMCVHVGLVPVQFATRHIRSLASALFETSLGAHYPISLIQ